MKRTTIAEVIIETEEIETIERRPARESSKSEQPTQHDNDEKENQNDLELNEADSQGDDDVDLYRGHCGDRRQRPGAVWK
jgi:hypothetical protein